jgi:hypothetical protein
MAAEQLPASQFTVNGQTAIAGFVVVQEVDGFEEDTESKQTASGAHKADITYSRRKTKSLTLEVTSAAVAGLYIEGGGLNADYLASDNPVWEIRSASRTNTRGPIQIQLELVALVDTITA